MPGPFRRRRGWHGERRCHPSRRPVRSQPVAESLLQNGAAPDLPAGALEPRETAIDAAAHLHRQGSAGRADAGIFFARPARPRGTATSPTGRLSIAVAAAATSWAEKGRTGRSTTTRRGAGCSVGRPGAATPMRRVAIMRKTSGSARRFDTRLRSSETLGRCAGCRPSASLAAKVGRPGRARGRNAKPPAVARRGFVARA